MGCNAKRIQQQIVSEYLPSPSFTSLRISKSEMHSAVYWKQSIA